MKRFRRISSRPSEFGSFEQSEWQEGFEFDSEDYHFYENSIEGYAINKETGHIHSRTSIEEIN